MKTIKFNEEAHCESQRCKATTSRGACQHLAVGDTKRCSHHGANKVIQKNKRESLMNYNLTKFKIEVDEKTNSTDIKSLKEEVGILRQMFQTIWNTCEDQNALIINNAVLSDLIVKIQKCVAEMTKLDVLNSRMVDKDELAKFGAYVINIVSEHVEDKEVIMKISQEMIKALDSME